MKINNSYFNDLPRIFYSKEKPDKIENPQLILFNRKLAKEIGFETNIDLAKVFSGNELLKGSEPISMSYAGHQFGNLVPSLGDGRALLLGEIEDEEGNLLDITLKGSGKTSYSRGGDGKYPIGPAIREYLLSEAMHYLKIPTTRSLALISTNETVFRQKPANGAVLTRIAKSHIRIGTFEYFSLRGDLKNIKILADYAIKRHYPKCLEDKNIYLEFLKQVIKSQASLIASWMSVGFIHGVLNSDNVTISGQTIDFGPCAFLEQYQKNKVFSSIDRYGRYSFSNQKNITAWNLTRLAESILPLIDKDITKAVKLAENELNKFYQIFDKLYFSKMAKKIGIFDFKISDQKLIEDLLTIFEEKQIDFTNGFRNLKNLDLNEKWKNCWLKRISQQKISLEEIYSRMNKVNPVAIPRNHLVEKAIGKAENENDFSETEKLLKIIQKPFVKLPDCEEYYLEAKENEEVTQTFCGT
ncbi:MAG: hypothetical protein ACJAW3_000854 [Lentimonas sp.]